MVCDASRSSESQKNGPFHRIVWQGLIFFSMDVGVYILKTFQSRLSIAKKTHGRENEADQSEEGTSEGQHLCVYTLCNYVNSI